MFSHPVSKAIQYDKEKVIKSITDDIELSDINTQSAMGFQQGLILFLYGITGGLVGSLFSSSVDSLIRKFFTQGDAFSAFDFYYALVMFVILIFIIYGVSLVWRRQRDQMLDSIIEKGRLLKAKKYHEDYTDS